MLNNFLVRCSSFRSYLCCKFIDKDRTKIQWKSFFPSNEKDTENSICCRRRNNFVLCQKGPEVDESPHNVDLYGGNAGGGVVAMRRETKSLKYICERTHLFERRFHNGVSEFIKNRIKLMLIRAFNFECLCIKADWKWVSEMFPFCKRAKLVSFEPPYQIINMLMNA